MYNEAFEVNDDLFKAGADLKNLGSVTLSFRDTMEPDQQKQNISVLHYSDIDLLEHLVTACSSTIVSLKLRGPLTTNTTFYILYSVYTTVI